MNYLGNAAPQKKGVLEQLKSWVGLGGPKAQDQLLKKEVKEGNILKKEVSESSTLTKEMRVASGEIREMLTKLVAAQTTILSLMQDMKSHQSDNLGVKQSCERLQGILTKIISEARSAGGSISQDDKAAQELLALSEKNLREFEALTGKALSLPAAQNTQALVVIDNKQRQHALVEIRKLAELDQGLRPAAMLVENNQLFTQLITGARQLQDQLKKGGKGKNQEERWREASRLVDLLSDAERKDIALKTRLFAAKQIEKAALTTMQQGGTTALAVRTN